MELKVIKTDGTETGRTVNLNDNVFGIEPNNHVIWLDVKHYLANQRQGTHSTKEKSMVSGSTRKLRVVVEFLDRNHVITVLNLIKN